MADEAAHKPGPFDVETVRHLVEMMAHHDLSEILLEQGEARIRLRRGLAGTVVTTSPVIPAAMTASSPPVPSGKQPPAQAPSAKALHEIKSPMVGTFYKAEKPDAQPYVKLGSRVTPSTVIGIIEAMKVYNEIQAECNGVIVEICVDNSQPVEFNTVLFRVDPTA